MYLENLMSRLRNELLIQSFYYNKNEQEIKDYIEQIKRDCDNNGGATVVG